MGAEYWKAILAKVIHQSLQARPNLSGPSLAWPTESTGIQGNFHVLANMVLRNKRR